MTKTVPTFGRIAVMVGFALSCFGLLLFLWLSFGGALPLGPKGYRFQVAFKEATQLAQEADVRIAGVPVGKVRRIERDPAGGRTLATIELDERHAPIPADARAVLREKTLLGETYVELTPGTAGAPKVPEGGRLAGSRVAATVQFDEILSTFDPETRRALQVWQQDLGLAVEDAGPALSDAIGALPGLAEEGADTLGVLDRQEAALGRLVRDAGTVFEALTEREDKLRGLVVNTRDVFDETQRRADALAATVAAFPPFLTESRRLFERTERFAAGARPVVRLLREPVRDLGPTLGDLAKAAPDVERGFRGLEALRVASRDGLPALGEVLTGTRPFLAELRPFLDELVPIFRFLEQNQYPLADLLGGQGSVGLAPHATSRVPGAPGHYLRQINPAGSESLALWPRRLSSNRGNAYLNGIDLAEPRTAVFDMFPNFDCDHIGGEARPDTVNGTDGDGTAPGCFQTAPLPGFGTFPRVRAGATR